ncbi:MAG: hypothetical protein E7620_02040 [Ruminococcaceae bacterium]|nr:hypothetical protein [Oscillospiraceae bacterium]
MTNKNTKRALLTSVMSLLLCFTMLMGTTYAWFTDSVSSANNIIQSGNLDVELEYWNGEKWEDVEDVSEILTNKLWEPGVTEVAYLRVANAGTLALKYQLGINIVGEEKKGVNAEDVTFTLSDYIQFGVVEGIAVDANKVPTTYATREDAVAAVNANAKKISAGYTKASSMASGDELYLALVVYMPTSVGNVANYKTSDDATNPDKYRPEINLGINVIATQVASEKDSFDKYYDGATPWYGDVDTTWYNTTDTEFVIGTAEELAGLAAITNGYATVADDFAGKTIKLASNIDLNNLSWTPIADPMSETYVGFAGIFDGCGYTIYNLNIDNPTAWGQGLFGYTTVAVTVKNVNVHNANVSVGDNCGVIFGMCYNSQSTFSNITVSGNVSVISSNADGYAGGIVGYGYHANFENCAVIADNGVISSAGSFVGGIVGYQCNKAKTIKDCSVEGLTISGYGAVGGIAGIIQTGSNAIVNCSVKNVVLNKTRTDGNPSIGALVGCYGGTAATTLTGVVENVTLNGYHKPYSAYNTLYGSEYNGAVNPNFDVTGVTVNNLTNNLNELVTATPATVQNLINNASAGAIIALGEGTYNTIVMKSDITLVGTGSENVGCINLNGANNVTLKNIVFDAAGARMAYDGKGNARFYANILSGDAGKNGAGSRNLVIEGCTFTGAFANGGTTIAFNDQGRGSGQSGNITIKGCTFQTTGGYVDIYTYYAGYGEFVIEGNTFASDCLDRPIYLGKYQSSTPVVVKGNAFVKNATFASATYLQDHSSYGVSFDSTVVDSNTFGN